jgi:hypothetical protein
MPRVWTSWDESVFPGQTNDEDLVGLDLEEYREVELCSKAAHEETGAFWALILGAG